MGKTGSLLLWNALILTLFDLSWRMWNGPSPQNRRPSIVLQLKRSFTPLHAQVDSRAPHTARNRPQGPRAEPIWCGAPDVVPEASDVSERRLTPDGRTGESPPVYRYTKGSQGKSGNRMEKSWWDTD